MKNIELSMDTSQYEASILKLTTGYQDLSKAMASAARSATKQVSGTNELAVVLNQATEAEKVAASEVRKIKKALDTLTGSRVKGAAAARDQLRIQLAQAESYSSLITAKRQDLDATIAQRIATEEYTAAVKELNIQKKELALAEAQKTATRKDSAELAKTAREEEAKTKAAAKEVAAAAAKEARAEAEAARAVARVEREDRIKAAAAERQAARDLKAAERKIKEHQKELNRIQAEEAAYKKLQVTKANAVVEKLRSEVATQTVDTSVGPATEAAKQVQNQLLSWQGISRVLTAGIVFRGISGAINELQEAYDLTLKYSKAISEIQTISQSSNITTREWAEGLKKVSSNTGIDILKVAEGAYQALSNQITRGADTFKFLETANRFAMAAVTDTTTAVDILSSTMNSYGYGTERAEEIAAKYFKTIELGRVRASELKEVMGTLEVFGAQLGISFDELGATIATMTNQGINATKAGTQLRSMLTTLIKPTKDLKGLYQELGVATGEDAIATYGWEGILAKLAQTTKGSTGELGQLIHNQRALIAAMVLTGPALDQYRANLEKIKNSADSYKTAQEIVAESTAKTIEIATNNMTLFLESAGRIGTQTFAGLIDTLKLFHLSLESVFIGGGVAGAIVALSKMKTALTLTDLALIRTTQVAVTSTAAQIAAQQALGNAYLGAAAQAEIASVKTRISLTKTGVGAIVVGLGLVVGWLIEWARAAESTGDRITRINRELAESYEKLAREQKVKFDDSITKIEQNAVRALSIAKRATQESYTETVRGFGNVNKALSDELEGTLNTYRKGLDEVQKTTNLALSQSNRAVGYAVENDAFKLSVALAKIEDKGSNVTNAKALAKLEAETAKAEARHIAVQRGNRLAERTAAKRGNKEQVQEQRKQFVEEEVSFKASQAARELEKKEILDKAEVQKRTITLYQSELIKSEKLIASVNATDEAGLGTIKARLSQYENIAAATADQLLKAGEYNSAQALVNKTIEARAKVTQQIAELEIKVAEDKAEKELSREKKLTAYRLASEQLIQLEKLKGKLQTDDDESKRVERLTEVLRLTQEIASNASKAGPTANLPTGGLVKDSVTAVSALFDARDAEAQIASRKELADKIEAAKARQGANTAAVIAATKNQEDFTKAIQSTADLLAKIEARRSTKAGFTGGVEGQTLRAQSPIDPEVVRSAALVGANVSSGLTESVLSELNKGIKNVALLPKDDQPAATKQLTESISYLADLPKVSETLKNAQLQAAKSAEEVAAVSGTQKQVALEQVQALEGNKDSLDSLNATITKIGNSITQPTNNLARGGDVKYYSKGGGPRGTDTVPAWLTPGEFVVNRSSATRHRALLEAINNNSFAGSSRPMRSYYADGGQVGNSTTVGDIHISMSSNGSSEADVVAIGNQLKREIRRGRLSF